MDKIEWKKIGNNYWRLDIGNTGWILHKNILTQQMELHPLVQSTTISMGMIENVENVFNIIDDLIIRKHFDAHKLYFKTKDKRRNDDTRTRTD